MTKELVYEQVKPKSLAGRKTNIQRLELKAAEAQAQKRLEAEAKRAERYQPDTTTALRVALAMAGVPLATAGTISYSTTVAVAGWMRLPWPVLDYIVPGMIEALIIFSSFDYLISESRKLGAGRGPFWAMIGFSAIGVIGNAAFTISGWGSGFSGSNYQALIGTILSGLAPFVVVYVSKRLSKLVFAEAIA
jgi:hypothetical protein